MFGFGRGKRRFLCLVLTLALLTYAINSFYGGDIRKKIARFRQNHDPSDQVHSTPVVSSLVLDLIT